MNAREWVVRGARREDVGGAVDLMRRAFGDDRAPDEARRRWTWLYLENPAHAGLRYAVADAGGTLVGQYATLPMRMQHADRRVLGLVTVDAATDPSFERRGIFSALGRHVYESSKDTAIVYGFPNPIAGPVYWKKLGWTELRPFPLLLRPLGNLRRLVSAWRPRLGLAAVAADTATLLTLAIPRAVLRLTPASVVVDEVPGFGAWVDELWSELSPRLGTCAIRDASFVEWRFVQAPYTYTRFVVSRREVPVGLAVVRVVERVGGRLAHLMELMVRPDDASAARVLSAYVTDWSQRAGAAAVYAVATRRHPHRSSLLRCGFVPLPGRFTSHLSFGARPHNHEAVPERLLGIDEWYLSGADFDTL